MSFDDLNFHGPPSTDIPKYCPDCDKTVTLRVTYNQSIFLCPDCGCDRVRNPGSESGSVLLDAAPDLQEMFRRLLMNTLGEHMDPLEAQTALQSGDSDVLAQVLENSLLNDSRVRAPPTSKQFIESLKPKKLEKLDFIHPYVRVEGIEKDFLVTVASFGTDLLSLRGDSDEDMCHMKTSLIVADPICGMFPLPLCSFVVWFLVFQIPFFVFGLGPDIYLSPSLSLPLYLSIYLYMYIYIPLSPSPT